MKTKYVRNLTRDYVRIGRKDNEAIIYLEPAEMVTHIDPKTKERTVKPGRNVAEVEENILNMIQVKSSVGKLIEVITKAEYDKRVDEIYGWEAESAGQATVTGFKDRDHELNIVNESAKIDDSVKIAMDPQTLEIYAGAASGIQGNK